MEVIAGIDIGGTKCAVSFIHMNGDEVEFLSKEKRPTNEPHPDEMVQSFVNEIAEKLNDHPDWELVSIGISCGGPLDEEKGTDLMSAKPSALGSYRSFYTAKGKVWRCADHAAE